MPERTLFTSESVTEGHPDKIADQVSDAVLDAMLAQDPSSRVACETLLTTGLCVVAGEITSSAVVDINAIARKTIVDIGYDDDAKGFNGNSCAVLVALDKQSPDIAGGVDAALEKRTGSGGEDALNAQGAGDQGMMFGYAVHDNEDYMPLPIWLAHRLSMRMSQVRRSGQLQYLRPDAKTQVTVVYEGDRPVAIDTVLISHGTLSDQAACAQSVDLTMAELRTNALSVVAMLTLLANLFERRRAGTIAVISSVAGERGRQSNYIYGSAKAMVTAFLSGLRQRLAKAGVSVVTIKPGFVDTPMTGAFRKNALWIGPDAAAGHILNAIDRGTAVAYVPGFWR